MRKNVAPIHGIFLYKIYLYLPQSFLDRRGFEPGTFRLLSERHNRYSTEVCDEGAPLILIGNQICAYISAKYCVLLLAIVWDLEISGGY